MNKTCKHCDEEFDLHSEYKQRIGGLINECPWCVEEYGGDQSDPMYLGVSAGNGKMSDVTILKFETNEQRNTFAKAWQNNSGFNKGKSCQLGSHLTCMSGMSFELVSENRANGNHKGKM
jgi:hypothetical protein